MALCCAGTIREFSVWHSDILAKQRTSEGLRTALARTPSDSSKWTRLGILLLQKEPETSAAAFRRAVDLNRFETDALLGLALHAESNTDTKTAESFYLKAIESSRRFRPRYALAAFYARMHRMPEFWQTAAEASAIDQADVGRIIRLARETGADPDAIPTLLKLHTEHALATYLQTAIADGRPAPLANVATRLPATPEHQTALLAACNRLIEAGAAEPAQAVWNRLGLFEKLDVQAGRSLTNTGFVLSTIQGFNWRFNSLPGVRARSAGRGLRIEFTGEQPEHAVILEQIAPVLPSRSYRFSVHSEAVDLPAASGLSWQAQCIAPGVPTNPAPKRMEMTGTTVLELPAKQDCHLARIALLYNREPGTVRIEGSLDLLTARLELFP